MDIHPKGHFDIVVPKKCLELLRRDAGFCEYRGCRVPMRYNKDKSKISRGSWGFWDLSLFFFRKKGPEIGVIRGGQKRRATIKDKNF